MLMGIGTVSLENKLALATNAKGRYNPLVSNFTGKTLAHVQQEWYAALFRIAQN